MPVTARTDSIIPAPGVFQTTNWSMIERARDPVSPAAAEALNHLCQTYWKPIHAHAQNKGLDYHEASDAVQEVFEKLLRNEFLNKVGRDRGRFRTYLLACLDHHLATRWSRSHAQKRGGAAEHVELSAAPERKDGARTPDQEFDYQWMLALLREVLRRLQAECEAEGRGKLYAALRGLLVNEGEPGGSQGASQVLGISDEAVRAALYRMRKRYKELFREEVARTLANPFEVEDELRQLLGIFQ